MSVKNEMNMQPTLNDIEKLFEEEPQTLPFVQFGKSKALIKSENEEELEIIISIIEEQI